ncbi:MAG: T9SS type A sorting domain-containing protein, partial [Bacteroidota bacterium]
TILFVFAEAPVRAQWAYNTTDSAYIYAFSDPSDSTLVRKEITVVTDSVERNTMVESSDRDTVTGDWQLNQIETKVVDEKGVALLWEVMQWDSVAHRWMNGMRYLYENDAEGRILSRLLYSWYVEEERWYESLLNEYYYDSLGNDTLYIPYYKGLDEDQWHRTKGSWYLNSYNKLGQLVEKVVSSGYLGDVRVEGKYEYTYDEEGNMVQELRYNGNGIDFVLSTKREIAYDAEGRDTLHVIWYWSQEEWEESRKIVNAYDAEGNHLKYEIFAWDYITADWLIRQRELYTYDPLGKLQTWVHAVAPQFRDPLETLKYDYTYDLHGEMGVMVTSRWDTTDAAYVLTEKKYHFPGNVYYTLHDSICQGETYPWQEDEIDSEGEYHAAFTSVMGSDSSYTLYLKVNPNPAPFTITGRTLVCDGETVLYTAPENPEVEYRWSVEHAEIRSGIPNDTLDLQWVGAAGIEEVTAWAVNIHGCSSDTALLQVEVTICDGLEELPGGSIVLYPVPVHDILRITSDTHIAQVEIVDLKGQTVLTAGVTGDGLDLTSLEVGVYLIRMTDRSGTIITTRKIVKQ